MNSFNTGRVARFTTALATGILIVCAAGVSLAEGAAELEREANAALEHLYATTPAARTLGAEAKGILVFPQVGKIGFIFAGEFGVGALFRNRSTAGFYNISEVSAGYQAGVEKFSYALFFMTDEALAYLDKTEGFSLGAGPSLTVVDKGFASSFTTTTIRDDVYAFSFGEVGLMGGISLKGSKITRYHPK